MSDSTVIGIVLIARHGDRYENFQNPDTFAVSQTAITPLGEQQEWQLGNFLRSVYLDPTSPSYIEGISPSTSVFNSSQVAVYADNDFPDDTVILDSAVALTQGLWPPTALQKITLANGTTITNPLGGYQYVPVNGINPDKDVSLEGTTDCTTFLNRAQVLYNSTLFQEVSADVSAFFAALPPYVGGRPIELQNSWNIFDYMNVQDVHNATYASTVPETLLEQARALANWEQYQVFSDPSFNGIGNIAFQAMIPGIIAAFNDITYPSSGLKLTYYAINYKPFLSMFNMTGVVADGSLPEAFVNYASAVVFEVRTSASSPEPFLRFQFKNGTDDTELHSYPLAFAGWDGTTSGTDVPLSTFISAFQPAGINTTLEWCNACGQTTERGCDVALAAASAGVTASALVAREGMGAYSVEHPVHACNRTGSFSTGMWCGALSAVIVLMVIITGLMVRWKRGKSSKAAVSPLFGMQPYHYVDEKTMHI
ncbi:histidine phosphatase superfamily [Fomitopsis serialis]|uniref:histidine phosphatase superfamily n=1 Tax=Fomitopsis serialis TaxID=139415 RepID=UPI002008D231|nr:histidine phosphatase superfamily [Neoantrodia serialis]KAH9922607.1 histidine phosphatase superfamily [Neoantrodia serialis]